MASVGYVDNTFDFSALDSNWSSVDPGQLAKPLDSGRRLRWSLTGFCQSFTEKWINPMTWWHRLAIRPTNSVQLTRGQGMCKSSFDLPVPPLKRKSRWWKSYRLFWDSSWFSTAVGQATCFWVWGNCAGPSPVSAKVSEQNEFDMQTNSLQVTNSIWNMS